MIDSGLPIAQAVRSLAEQSQNPLVEEALYRILRDLENGYKLSEAIAKFPKIFNGVFVSVVAAGEASGHLDVALGLLADELERDQGFRGRVIGSLLYPGFIVVAMFVVGIIMVTRIVPALESVFQEANVQLPWTTRLVVAVTNSIIHGWYVYIIIIGLIIFGISRYIATPEGRRLVNARLLHTPVVGNLITNLEMARFTRILAILLQAGVPIIKALDAVSLVMDNMLYQEAVHAIARNVERGAPISQTMAKQPSFPVTVTQMIAVGEETGKLDTVLNKLADYYETETNQSIKNVAALVEPVVFVIVGLGVAFIVFSIIVPIYSLSSVIK